MTITTIQVLAELPLPNRCKPKLITGYTPDWIAGFYAAMLRDTLDGLLSIDASENIVVRPAGLTEDEANVFGRHVHAPWTIHASPAERESTSLVVVARADAPSADIAPLSAALTSASAASTPRVVVGANARGVVWAALSIGLSRPFHPTAWELEAIRAQCRGEGVAFEELPPSIVIDETDDVLALLEELRRHPERAPRTAQFVVTRG